MDKQAVDEVAKNYWTSYYKEFGKMWVRDIPRRIKAAVARETKSAAIEGDVAPVASSIGSDGTLSLEAAFVGTLDGKQARVLVTAEFEQSGKLNKMEVTRIS